MLLQKYVRLEINVIGHDNRSDSILLKKHETGHTEDRLLNLNSERNVYDGYVSMTWKHIIIFFKKNTNKYIKVVEQKQKMCVVLKYWVA